MREEFEAVCRKYYNRIYLFLLKLCGDKELAEDLTQETFYQTIRSLHRYSGDSDMFTFIASIAKHTYYKYLRKNKQHLKDVSFDVLSEMIPEGVPNDPVYRVERAGETAALRQAIDELPEKYRDVVFYRIYAEMSFAQTADALGITENSAKVIFFRAKKKLSEKIKKGELLL